MNKKNSLALVLGGTANIANAVYATFSSIVDNSNLKDFSFVIYHDDWDDNLKKIFYKKFENVIFKNYTIEYFRSKVDDELIDLQTWSMKTFSYMVYCKFEIFNLLSQYRRVIWFDSDLYIRKDINDILRYEPIAATKIPSNLSSMFKKEDSYNNIPAYNGGVIYVTDKISYEGLSDTCYQLMSEHFSNLLLPDQAVMGLLYFIKHIDITNLPVDFNDSVASYSDSCIVHFNRKYAKPWNNALVRMMFPKYLKYFDEFKSLLNTNVVNVNKSFFSDFVGDSLKSTLSKLETQAYWKYIYSLLSPCLKNTYFIDVFWGDCAYILNKQQPHVRNIYLNRTPMTISFSVSDKYVWILKRYLTLFNYKLSSNTQKKVSLFTFQINLFNLSKDINTLIDIFEPYIYIKANHVILGRMF